MKRDVICIVWVLFAFLLLRAEIAAQGLMNNGAFFIGSSGSFVHIGGASDFILQNTIPGRMVFDNVTVDFSGSGLSTLTVPYDSYITVNGNLNLHDSLILEASSSGMASLITNGTVTGNYAAVEEYLHQDRWHLVSPPVSNALSNVYMGIYLKYFKENDSTWNYIWATNTPLNVAGGYAVWSSSGLMGNTKVFYKGLLNTGDKNPSLSYNFGSGKGDGWNLIGNPYPSAVDWNTNWTTSAVDATIYVYNGSQYLTWNRNLGGYGTKTDGSIPSTQGFWIKANNINPSITIPNSERIHSPQSFYKEGNLTENLNNLLNIKAEGNGYSDIALIGFHPDATEGFDSDFDAYKIMGIYAAPQIYSKIPGINLSVNILPKVFDGRIVQLGFQVGYDTTYTLTVTGISNLQPGVNVFLEDQLASFDDFVYLNKTPVYTFLAKEEDNPERFRLHYFRGQEPWGIHLQKEDILIYAYDKTIYIVTEEPQKAAGRVEIYNMLGGLEYFGELSPKYINTINFQQKFGYYIVKVINNAYFCTGKVYIR